MSLSGGGGSSSGGGSGGSGFIDLPLIERITLDPEAAFANCLIENIPNGKALFVRKKDDIYGSSRSSSDVSDSYRISNTVAVLGPPSSLKRRVIDLLLESQSHPHSTSSLSSIEQTTTTSTLDTTNTYTIRNYATTWSSGIGVSYSNETHLVILDVPTDGYPHKIALSTLFALSVSQAVLIVCSEVCTPSTLPDTTQCALLHGIAKSKASLPETHSAKIQNFVKERPTLGFVLPHFAPSKSEALLVAWSLSAQCSSLFADTPTSYLRVPVVPEWQHKFTEFMISPSQFDVNNNNNVSQNDFLMMDDTFRKSVMEGMLHEQNTGMESVKTWCTHIADVASALTPSSQNPLGLAVTDALKIHVSGALRSSMVVCSRAVREARQVYAAELPSKGGYSKEAHEKHVEKALHKFRSIAAGVAVDDYASYLKKKLVNEWVSPKNY